MVQAIRLFAVSCKRRFAGTSFLWPKFAERWERERPSESSTTADRLDLVPEGGEVGSENLLRVAAARKCVLACDRTDGKRAYAWII